MNVELLHQDNVIVRAHCFPAEIQPENGCAPKLAIVSAYDCLCGIAEYTYFLVQSLRKFADVTVIELDQHTFKNSTRMAREDAEKQLKIICNQLGKFDAVNLQFEPGTLGYKPQVAYRRLTEIVDASPAISVTFHTFLDDNRQSRGFWKELKKLRIKAALFGRGTSRSRYYLTTKPIQYIKAAGKQKDATFIVHTRREVERLVRVHGVSRTRVYDHPLAFLNPELVSNLEPSSMIRSLRLPEDTVTLGVFGFISEYKGTDLAVDVMKLLPQNYHLLIAGGLHPNESRAQATEIHPYLARIIGKILGDSDQAKVSTRKSKQSSQDLMDADSSLLDRVHFLGAQDRQEFLQIMHDCDVVVLPYREVGQTSSGPISMAVEMKKRVIASRTDAFAEFGKYYPSRMEHFDQNNFIELSQRICAPQELEDNPVELSWLTNVQLYFEAHGFDAVSEYQINQCEQRFAKPQPSDRMAA